MIQEKFHIMIIDSDVGNRARLKELCHSSGQFQQIDSVEDLQAANHKLNRIHHRVDIIFFSSQIHQEEMIPFIRGARKMHILEDTAFIIMRRMDEQVAHSESEAFIIGSDGVLFEPFSNDSILEACNLAQQVRKDRTKERLAEHVSHTVHDILVILNHIAFLQSSSYVIAPALKQFRRLTSLMMSLPAEQAEIYYSVLAERLENPPPRGPYPYRYRYIGKSLRARKRLQKKALAALGYDTTGL